MSNTNDPQKWAMNKFLMTGDQAYLDMSKMWAKRIEGTRVELTDYVEEIKDVVTESGDDCESCKI